MSSPVPPPLAPPPVRLRVYGFLTLTRRGYLRLLTAGMVLLLIVLFFWLTSTPPQPSGRNPPLPTDFVLIVINKYVPWIILAAVILESIEAAVILRRFARAEARQRQGAPGAPVPPKP